MTEKEIIELFMSHVEEMRTHQKAWFARKMPADLKLSKKESDVDNFLKQLRRRGYVPAQQSKTEQEKLF